MEVVEAQWTFGRRNNIRRLDPDEKWLTGLAEYLSKDPKGKKREKADINNISAFWTTFYNYSL